jgi:hypothetical protein
MHSASSGSLRHGYLEIGNAISEDNAKLEMGLFQAVTRATG